MVDDKTGLIGALRYVLLKHRYRYYVLCNPSISDREYDMAERQLRELVTEFPLEASQARYDSICPVVTIGSDIADSYPVECRID